MHVARDLHSLLSLLHQIDIQSVDKVLSNSIHDLVSHGILFMDILIYTIALLCYLLQMVVTPHTRPTYPQAYAVACAIVQDTQPHHIEMLSGCSCAASAVSVQSLATASCL